MKFKTSNVILTGLVVGTAYILIFSNTQPEFKHDKDINIPILSQEAQKGEKIFNSNCAKCHGNNAIGSDKGPPLIHNIYNPGHHSNLSFYRAVKMGTKQHHWRFGNMPAQRHVKESDVTLIIKYIRELQVANGIIYKEHRM
ncbi:MAG: cytochrome C [Alphaproteobacteria bacterium]|nr:MAG: cytochrome C [Alphaproteobacteria bacterium]